MTDEQEPDSGGVERRLTAHGKVAYLRIPAGDTVGCAHFYAAVFGWEVGGQPDHVSFRDGSGDLIGAFVPDRVAARDDTGVLPFIYVEGIDAVMRAIVEHGGEIVMPKMADEELWTATFRDTAGNLMGIWEAFRHRDT